MVEGTLCKPVIVSNQFNANLPCILDYSLETFGYFQSERYKAKIEKALSTLSCYYTWYPECRYIPTKSRMYRNVVLDAHLIIYRITKQRIEVLDIIHAASSISKIISTRKISL
jgi:plasmid stabilization system protein ParE